MSEGTNGNRNGACGVLTDVKEGRTVKRISRSESKRNLLVGLVMSVLFMAGLAGPAPASAEPAAGTGFLWGPAATQEEMRSPLNDGMVLDALDMAVDEDSISARVLGQSSLLVFVYDASQPDTLEMGSTTSIRKAPRPRSRLRASQA